VLNNAGACRKNDLTQNAEKQGEGYRQAHVFIVSLPGVGCAVSTVAIVELADNKVRFVVG
jgi:hypothetical protein